MESENKLSVSSRVRACTECRQHKLRCDATKDNSIPCSRCRRRGLHCEITTAFRRTKRRTKKDLQAELESLREQVESQGSTGTPVTYTAKSTGSNTGAASIGVSSSGLLQHNTSTTTPSSLDFASTSSPEFSHGGKEIMNRPPLGEPLLSASTMPTLSRTLAGQEFSPQTIDSCFNLFQARYLQHVPIFEGRLRPNLTYLQSELLFWTIIAVGARRFQDDPTLLTSLQPYINDLASQAILSREAPLPTIKALILLCAWSLPHDSLSKDISPMLAGSLLQQALITGLHIYGVGQDFSRTKIPVDRAQIHYRRRLWEVCVTVCQRYIQSCENSAAKCQLIDESNRVSCTTGIPPCLVPDTYNRSGDLQDGENLLPPSVAFEKILSAIQTEGIMQLERSSLATPPNERASVLNPIIKNISEQLLQLLPQSPGDIAAQVQVLCFHLFVPRESIKDSQLWRLYELACMCIETAQRIEQGPGLSDCAPIFVSKYLDMAAFAILKISRCHMSESLDLDRGRRAYFFVINFCRNVSVQSGDIMSRSEGILTQLWASKNIFRRPDGSIDSLTLRCGSRLGMSVVYDCLWWWRSEFGGQPDPYENNPDSTSTQSAEPSQQTQFPPVLDSFDDPTALDFTFPESQWATTQDLLSLDWSQYQYDVMLPLMDLQTNSSTFESDAIYMANTPAFQQPLQQQV